jgi:hypothetical protein
MTISGSADLTAASAVAVHSCDHRRMRDMMPIDPAPERPSLPARDRWVSRRRVVASLHQADARLGDELADALPDTIDDRPER